MTTEFEHTTIGHEDVYGALKIIVSSVLKSGVVIDDNQEIRYKKRALVRVNP